MITEKQKCIAEQAVYGDLTLDRRAYDDVEEKYIIEQVDSKWVLDFINYDKLLSLTPILRPLSDLTKTVTHKGYNEEKPFIPLVELARVIYNNPDADYIIDKVIDACGEVDIVKLIDLDTDEIFAGYAFNEDFISLKELDLLNVLHFDTRNLIPTGQAIDANTLPENPYEV